MSEPLAIELKNVSKAFGSLQAVDDVSLSIHPGEIFGVIGPNGAGKSTCVNMICGMMRPDRGSVGVLGLDPTREEKKLRQVLGVQFQEAQLPEQITVGEAMALYGSFYSKPKPAAELLQEWGLESKVKDKFGKLSGGQKQRLFICLALINDPQVVVLDELTTGLDPQARRNSWDLVKKIRDNGTTVLLVTHFMEEAEHLCDRIALINNGKVQALGTPDELTRGSNDEREISFTAPDGFDALSLSRIGHVDVRGNTVSVRGGRFLMADVAAALRDKDIDPADLSTRHGSLEDLFLEMTKSQKTEESK